MMLWFDRGGDGLVLSLWRLAERLNSAEKAVFLLPYRHFALPLPPG